MRLKLHNLIFVGMLLGVLVGLYLASGLGLGFMWLLPNRAAGAAASFVMRLNPTCAAMSATAAGSGGGPAPGDPLAQALLAPAWLTAVPAYIILTGACLWLAARRVEALRQRAE